MPAPKSLYLPACDHTHSFPSTPFNLNAYKILMRDLYLCVHVSVCVCLCVPSASKWTSNNTVANGISSANIKYSCGIKCSFRLLTPRHISIVCFISSRDSSRSFVVRMKWAHVRPGALNAIACGEWEHLSEERVYRMHIYIYIHTARSQYVSFRMPALFQLELNAFCKLFLKALDTPFAFAILNTVLRQIACATPRPGCMWTSRW